MAAHIQHEKFHHAIVRSCDQIREVKDPYSTHATRRSAPTINKEQSWVRITPTIPLNHHNHPAFSDRLCFIFLPVYFFRETNHKSCILLDINEVSGDLYTPQTNSSLSLSSIKWRSLTATACWLVFKTRLHSGLRSSISSADNTSLSETQGFQGQIM